MATITPNWTDAASFASGTATGTVARGSTTRLTLNLAAKIGAMLQVSLGRGGTAALTNGVDVLVRRVVDIGGGIQVAMPVTARRSGTVAANSTTVGTDSNSAQAVLNATAGTGIVADDWLCIQDSGGGTTRLEFQRVSKLVTNTVTLDKNLQYTHTSAQADTIRTKADVFPGIWLPGGSLYEIIVDYGDDAAGDTITYRVVAQTYDSDAA